MSADARSLYQQGILSMQRGDVDAGIAWIERSLLADPGQAAVALTLARACRQAGRHEDALAACERAVRLQPDYLEGWYERANALLQLQRVRGALAGYDALLARAPGHVGAWCNRGTALQILQDPAAAVESFDRALALQPGLAAGYLNRGNAQRLLRQWAAALGSYEQALRLDDSLVEAHSGRGLALGELGESILAHAAFEAALALRPDDPALLIQLGNSWRRRARPDLALACYERALLQDPDSAEALCDQGNALTDLADYAAAIASYDAALSRRPDVPEILANRAGALERSGRFDLAVNAFEHLLSIAPDFKGAREALFDCRLRTCEWRQFDEQRLWLRESVAAGRELTDPFAVLAVDDTAAAQLRAARSYADTLTHIAPSLPIRAASGSTDRIRVAYVSADLRDHALSYLMAGVFENHDRDQFEIYAMSLRPADPSAFGRRVAAAFEHFEELGRRSDEEIVKLIRQLEIDVAIDLMGYTRNARVEIFAQRVAPVQASYLGYPATMGACFMDYLIADEFVIPRDSRAHYAEQIVYLPGCFQANDDLEVTHEIDRSATRRLHGLPQEAHVLCSFNNSYKLNPTMFDVWMRILRAVPGSVLWLLGDLPRTRENLRREAAARGVDAHRLVFANRCPYDEHLARLRCADLVLDTLPYNAGATASDALRVGVPVLTCAGEAFAARMAGSLLRSLELPELITTDLQTYERRALELLQYPAIEALKERLDQPGRRKLLFDSKPHCRALEQAYVAMHARARRGEPPAAFTVTPPQFL